MSKKKKVLVADGVDDILLKGLTRMGYSVNYNPDIEYREVLKIVGEYSGIVINTRTPAPRELLEKAVQLQWIARLGSGLDIIDLDEAKNRKVEVINSPEGNANAVAEHMLGMLLCLLRNINRADREMRAMVWNREKNRGRELGSMTVGIIGFGNTGSAFAKVLRGLGCKILVYDKYKTNYNGEDIQVMECESMEEVLKNADVVSLHLPLNKETHALADKEFFTGCKKGAIFLNSSRGKLTVTRDLLVALEEGPLGGACLDVFENEKPNTFTPNEKNTFKKLAARQDVILSPHIAGW
nr:hydroxyacid dehydrogenase [Saprospiraceae bacterium]